MAWRGDSGLGNERLRQDYTLLRLIAGLEAPSSGSVEIEDEEVSSARYVRPPEERGLGMVVQEYALFPHMTAAANVAFGLRKLDRESRDASGQRNPGTGPSRRARRQVSVRAVGRPAAAGRARAYPGPESGNGAAR